MSIISLSKGGGKYRGIGMIEVMWKDISLIVERHLANSINFHDILHGLWDKIGTGTANFDSNVLQKIPGLFQKVLYEIFIYIHKSCYSLFREQNLMIMEGCRVVPQVLLPLSRYWYKLEITEISSGYYSKSFQRSHGVAHWVLPSPKIFTVVFDAISETR